MATKTEVLDVIDLLNTAYGKPLNVDRTDLYVRMLEDVPLRILQGAAEDCIRENKWYPTISELRAGVERMAGTHDMDGVPQVDTLAATMLELERQFYQTGVLEIELWNSIANQYANMGREHRAQFCQEKLRRLKTI